MDIRRDDLRASEVIRHIRALLRKRELEIRPLDLNEVTAEVLHLVGADTLRRKVTVSTAFAGDLPPVQGDRVHLQQVLLNLILNAVEAMAEAPPAKRQLSVHTSRNGDAGVELALADAGHGIAPERLPRLFDSFFTTKQGGMGLGLAIARSIIEAHGGRIWAENNPRSGATFRLTLPLAAGKPDP